MKPVSHLQAISFALAAYTCWVFADTNLKIAGASRLPAYEVIALVGLAEATLLVLLRTVQGNVRELWPRNPPRQLLRACLDLANNLCVVVALRHLPLALFYILIFLAPMVTTLLATAFLGVIGSLCFFAALKNTTAATVSQYHYSQLLTGALVAWIIWRERLTPSMFLGATLILGAGIYTALASHRIRQPNPALQT